MELTKEENSLLLYMETQTVDYGGKLQGVRMNADDFEIAKRWNEIGFVLFGRIAANDISTRGTSGEYPRTHWCVLSDEAWVTAHAERRARFERLTNKMAILRVGLTQCTE